MSQPSCKTWKSVDHKLHTRGRVPVHGKEKENGQKVKEDWRKRDLKLPYARMVCLQELDWVNFIFSYGLSEY